MRIIFLGAGEFGLPTLKRLHEAHDVVQVVTQPDRPAGRKQQLTPTAIGAWADVQGLPVIKTDSANDSTIVDSLRLLKADVAVVIAFGQKLSPQLIEALAPLVVNLHASLLPRYRGAAPINWAIIRGEKETGLSVISLAQRMDGGLIYAQSRTAIGHTETAGELHDRLSLMGPALIDQVLLQMNAGTLQGQTQDESLATRAPKFSKADSAIDFDQSPDDVRCRVHGMTPWPGAQAIWVQRGEAAGEEEATKQQMLFIRRVSSEESHNTSQPPGTILESGRVAVRGGTIQLLQVQLPGGRALPITDFLRGHAMRPGDVLRKGSS